MRLPSREGTSVAIPRRPGQAEALRYVSDVQRHEIFREIPEVRITGVRDCGGEPDASVAGFEPAIFASALVYGKAHPVPLTIGDRSEWFYERADRDRNIRCAPFARDHRCASGVQ